MTYNSKLESKQYSGTITAATFFANFANLTLMDAGTDGFRLKDSNMNIVNIPTGIAVNLPGAIMKLCDFISVLAPVTGTLNVTFISDVPGFSDTFTSKNVYGGLYNWYPASAMRNVSLDITVYGRHYNWYAATNAKGLPATGWHVWTKAESAAIMQYLDPSGTSGHNNIAGGKMKIGNSAYWQDPNSAADNSSGFNGKGSGYRDDSDGTFQEYKQIGYYVHPDVQYAPGKQIYACMLHFENSIFDVTYGSSSCTAHMNTGLSIRLIKNSTTLTNGQTGTYTGNDGTIYPTICIGSYEMLALDLRETKYADGSTIPVITDNTSWFNDSTGASCTYINSISAFAPIGFHIPTEAEFLIMANNLGSYPYLTIGGFFKEIGFDHWNPPNTGADNRTGFTGIGSGLRDDSGLFSGLKQGLSLWTATDYGIVYDPYRYRGVALTYNSMSLAFTINKGNYGFAVRPVKDDSNDPGSVTDIDGNVYPTIKIGSQVWLARNLITEHYNDGSAIPIVQANAAWAALVTGGMCYYNNVA
jgi:uncharacterized protein (TIGR02145 family)